jgi:hypothetical protein
MVEVQQLKGMLISSFFLPLTIAYMNSQHVLEFMFNILEWTQRIHDYNKE